MTQTLQRPESPFRETIGSVLYEFRWLVSDTAMMTWRNLMHYRRNPETLASTIAGPVMFLLLFNYVFGGAIGAGRDFNYIDYLVPGILIQNNLFTVMNTGIGIAQDLQKGFVDRYRSLPMARSAVLGGRVCATTLVSFASVYWTLAIALIFGMRFHGGPCARTHPPTSRRRVLFRLRMGIRTRRSLRTQRRNRQLIHILRSHSTNLPQFHIRPHRNHARLATSLRRGKPHHPRRKPMPQPRPRRPPRILRMGHHLLDRPNGHRNRLPSHLALQTHRMTTTTVIPAQAASPLSPCERGANEQSEVSGVCPEKRGAVSPVNGGNVRRTKGARSNANDVCPPSSPRHSERIAPATCHSERSVAE